MSGYAAYPFYDIQRGGMAVRLSMVDERGGEYFAIVSKPKNGREWRDKRRDTLHLVEQAILRQDGPGEVMEASDGEEEAGEAEGDEG